MPGPERQYPVRFAVRLTADQGKALSEIASIKGKTTSDLIRAYAQRLVTNGNRAPKRDKRKKVEPLIEEVYERFLRGRETWWKEYHGDKPKGGKPRPTTKAWVLIAECIEQRGFDFAKSVATGFWIDGWHPSHGFTTADYAFRPQNLDKYCQAHEDYKKEST